MESLFLELKTALENQKETMKQLLNTAREHNRALRQLDEDFLNTVLRKEEELSALINRQDKDRQRIVDILAEGSGLAGDATLGQLINFAPLQLGQEIKEISDKIKIITLDLKEINDQNGMLTRQAMRVNEIILNALVPGKKKTYSPDGRKSGDGFQLSLLDKKV